MKQWVAALAVSLSFGFAGCDNGNPVEAGAAPHDSTKSEKTSAAKTEVLAVPAGDAIPGAPDFVTLYPGGEIMQQASQGRAHQITFTTDADPDTIIEFYKHRAESSGLRPTAAMNQGGARAYGAAHNSKPNHSLEVVASPSEEGLTLVQLSWKS